MGQVVGYSLVAPIECLREFLAGVAAAPVQCTGLTQDSQVDPAV
jgi:hypothetical protein